MNKKIVFFIFAALLGLTCVVSAQQAEEIIFTTYYPSPYGSYNELDVTNLVYNPQAADPSNSKEGQVVYIDTNPADTDPGRLRIFSGGNWRNIGFGGGAPIGVRAAYTNTGVTSVSIDKPEGARYALLSIKGNTAYASGQAAEEDHETMEVFIDFSTNRSYGIHSLSGGGADPYVFQYAWNDQPLGSNITVMTGDTTGPTTWDCKAGPNFTVSGSNLNISNLSGSATYLWQHSLLVIFY